MSDMATNTAKPPIGDVVYSKVYTSSLGDILLETPPAPVEIENDPVEHPSHYTENDIECIDAIESSMTPEQFRGYLKGNAMKYLWRYEKKENPIQDLRKAIWYLERLVGHLIDEQKQTLWDEL